MHNQIPNLIAQQQSQQNIQDPRQAYHNTSSMNSTARNQNNSVRLNSQESNGYNDQSLLSYKPKERLSMRGTLNHSENANDLNKKFYQRSSTG